MSPEQVRGLPIDRRSDIFAVGIVLYELLTGERLFIGESDFSTLEKVRNVEILPPSSYNTKIPEELERIVLKALAQAIRRTATRTPSTCTTTCSRSCTRSASSTRARISRRG